MANASKSRRSRKRRPATGGAAPNPRPKAPNPKPRVAAQPSTTLGERPQAPWHPLPLSEILILVGAIGTIVGLRRGSNGTASLVAGLVAVGLGTFEVTLREHRSGYRSHTILLALVVVLIFHSVVVVGASAVAHPSQLLNVLLLPFDLALFVVCFKLLRALFLEARQARAVGRR